MLSEDDELIESTSDMQLNDTYDKENVAPLRVAAPITTLLTKALSETLPIGRASISAASGFEIACEDVSHGDYCDYLRLAGRSAISLAEFNELRRVGGLYWFYIMPYPLGFNHCSGSGFECWMRVLDTSHMSTPEPRQVGLADRRTWAPAPSKRKIARDAILTTAGGVSPAVPDSGLARPFFRPVSKFSDFTTRDAVASTAGSTPRRTAPSTVGVILDYSGDALQAAWNDDPERRLSVAPLEGVDHRDIKSAIAYLEAASTLRIDDFARVVMPPVQFFVGDKPYVAKLPLYQSGRRMGTICVIVVPSFEELAMANAIAQSSRP